MPTYPSLSLFPIMSESSRQCRNFHHHVGIFYSLFPFPLRDFSHHVGIFPFPTLSAGKIPSLLMEGIPCKKKLLRVTLKYSYNCRGNHPSHVKPYPNRVKKKFPFHTVSFADAYLLSTPIFIDANILSATRFQSAPIFIEFFVNYCVVYIS
jgi:hypothetical protein